MGKLTPGDGLQKVCFVNASCFLGECSCLSIEQILHRQEGEWSMDRHLVVIITRYVADALKISFT